MNLLSIAVAECIYRWEYTRSPWRAGYWKDCEGNVRKLVDWLDYRNAIDLLHDMREIFKYRAIIEMPLKQGGNWLVIFRKFDGTIRLLDGADVPNDIDERAEHWGTGKTLEEAIVRGALSVVGVVVE